ncbi:MAG: sterol desaturase family protein [Pseudomonadales bacterium]
MDGFVEFLNGLSAGERSGLLFVFLFSAIVIERLFPLLRIDKPLQHIGVNLLFLLGIGVVNTLVAVLAFVILRVHEWTFGLLHWLELSLWADLLIAIVALDFVAQYAAHWMLHNFKWLWRFHVVHHSDTEVDASTGTRLHPGDFLFREVLVVVTIVALGLPIAGYFLYRLLTPFFSYATHANIQLPVWIDQPLSWLLVTPNMHKVHHHAEQPWTNCNYGNILSVWDRLFHTYAYAHPREIEYGLDVLDGSRDRELRYLFTLPFSNFKTDH